MCLRVKEQCFEDAGTISDTEALSGTMRSAEQCF